MHGTPVTFTLFCGRVSAALLTALLAWSVFVCPDTQAKRLSAADEAIQVGVGALNDGFYDVAEKEFSFFVREYPTHERIQEVSYLLGRVLFQKGKLLEAKAVFSKISNEGKNFEQADFALFWQGVTEIRLSNRESARRLLSQLDRRFPRFEWTDHAHYLLGLLSLSLNDLPGAESFLRKSAQSGTAELSRSSTFWLGVVSCRGDDYRAAESFFQEISKNLSPSPGEYERQALFRLAEAQIKLGRYQQAKQTCLSYLDRFRGDRFAPEVSWRLGLCEFRLGNLKESVEVLLRMKNESKGPRSVPSLHYLLGEVYLEKGDFQDSIREWSSLLAGPPDLLWGASLLSIFWNSIHLGNGDEANKAFQRLLKLSVSEDEKVYIQWLIAELTFSEGRIVDALPYYFNIINSRFRERVLFRIGRGYFLEGKFREALTNLELLLLEFPNFRHADEALFLRGEAWIALGNPDPAFEAFHLLQGRKGTGPWTLMGSLEMVTFHLYRAEEISAEKILREIVERFPRQPLSDQAHYQLANLFFKRRNLTEAVRHYSLALKGKSPSLLGETYFRLGEAFYEQGKYDKAFSGFEYASEHLPESSPWFSLTQLEIAGLQKRWGKYKEARQACEIVLQRSKDQTLANAARELMDHVESK
jgi:TolA-binding protein